LLKFIIYIFSNFSHIFSIYFNNNSIIDTGAAIRDVTTKFWEQIAQYETDYENLFLEDSNFKLLNHNPNILKDDCLFLVGKILFWSFIHEGSWPTWLHPFHINFIMENSINVVEIFEELQPNLYQLAKQIVINNSTYNEIKDWWSNYRNIGVVSIIYQVNFILLFCF
jgi:hypothetical protein